MLDRSNELAAWDRDHFFHPSTHMGMHARGESPARVVAGGEGVTSWDSTGRKSIDAFAGLYCVNVGYGRQEIADAIAAQAKELAYYHAYVGHGTEVSIRLAKMIIDRAPEGMSRVIIPAQRYVRLIHDGPLEGIAAGFGTLYAYAEKTGLRPTDFKLDFGYMRGLPAGRHELHVALAPDVLRLA